MSGMRNDWMNGYKAAMKADKPADFEEWFQREKSGTNFYQWIKGWHSVWNCERKSEVES